MKPAIFSLKHTMAEIVKMCHFCSFPFCKMKWPQTFLHPCLGHICGFKILSPLNSSKTDGTFSKRSEQRGQHLMKSGWKGCWFSHTSSTSRSSVAPTGLRGAWAVPRPHNGGPHVALLLLGSLINNSREQTKDGCSACSLPLHAPS